MELGPDVLSIVVVADRVAAAEEGSGGEGLRDSRDLWAPICMIDALAETTSGLV